jgi:hypothetical protein
MDVLVVISVASNYRRHHKDNLFIQRADPDRARILATKLRRFVHEHWV